MALNNMWLCESKEWWHVTCDDMVTCDMQRHGDRGLVRKTEWKNRVKSWTNKWGKEKKNLERTNKTDDIRSSFFYVWIVTTNSYSVIRGYHPLLFRIKKWKKIEKLIFEYKLLNVHTYSFTFFLRYFGAIDLLIPQIV